MTQLFGRHTDTQSQAQPTSSTSTTLSPAEARSVGVAPPAVENRAPLTVLQNIPQHVAPLPKWPVVEDLKQIRQGQLPPNDKLVAGLNALEQALEDRRAGGVAIWPLRR